MSKYIVIPISISLKNNRFAQSGDLIDESQLNTNTHDLVSGGFIRLATEKEVEEAGLKSEEIEEIEEIEDLEDESQEENKKVSTQEISKKDQVKNAFTKK